MLRPGDFFKLDDYEHKGLFEDIELVWEVLAKIKPYIKKNITPNISSARKNGSLLMKTCILFKDEFFDEGFEIAQGEATKGTLKVFRTGKELKGASILYAGAIFCDDQISIGEGTVVEPGAFIKGPAILGNYTEVRQGAYMRGHCIVGDRCVVGHTTEIKNSVMFNDAKAGHFAYIGDSVLGNNVNLGAGTKLANLKIIESEIKLRIKRTMYNTGLRKFGAILADDVQTGCNSVTSPGSLLGKAALVYPCMHVSGGYYPPQSIISTKTKRVGATGSYKRKPR
jgi:bifunctional N-acetylglucosamine-1-phosphate-uridyltransferase/glucosamine-1-phosphate-acetyltransferase GlmU-like protein